MNKILFTTLLMTLILLSACGKKEMQTAPETAEETEAFTLEPETLAPHVASNEDIKTFDYQNKAFLVNPAGKRTDISEHVAGYTVGTLFVDSSGLRAIFGLAKVTASDEDKENYRKTEAEQGMHSAKGAEIIKFSKDGYTVLYAEGSSLCTVNRKPLIMEATIRKTDKGYAIPINDLPFALGYTEYEIYVEDGAVVFEIKK